MADPQIQQQTIQPTSSSQKVSANAFFIGLLFLFSMVSAGATGYFAGSYTKPQQDSSITRKEELTPTLPQLNNTNVPDAPLENEILFKNSWVTFQWKDIDEKELTASMYMTYVDDEGIHNDLVMGAISMERSPDAFIFGTKKFIFKLNYPDSYEYQLANLTTPFSVTKLSLPIDYKKQLSSIVIGFIDDEHIVYKQTEGYPAKISYWIAPLNNIPAAKKIEL